MDLKNILIKRKEKILDTWLMLIMKMYPEESAHEYLKAKDEFANPVGHVMREETQAIYEEIMKDAGDERLIESLENILKIRAVQSFSPASATSFVFLLKEAIRTELENELQKTQICQQLIDFELKIDNLALLAFDLYTKCRDTISEIRIEEIKKEANRAFKLLRKTDRFRENI